MTTIAFKIIPDYPEYFLDANGVVLRRTPNGNLRTIKPWLSNTHLMVTLKNGVGSKAFYLHRMTLIHFGPKQPKHLPLALHRDDNPFNNALDNLVWGDKKMNGQMALENGKLMDHHLKTYLTKDDASAALSDYRAGLSMAKVAKKYGCSRWTISNIVHGRTAKFL